MTTEQQFPETDQVEPVTDMYVAGLLFAADIVHAEARWQTELGMRHNLQVDAHRYAAERASKAEAAIRSLAEAVRPQATLADPLPTLASRPEEQA